MKKALITGASSGIGAAVAKQLADSGYAVTSISRGAGQSEPGIENVRLNLSEVDQLPQRLKESSALAKNFDLIVLNAGYGRFGGIEQFSYQQIKHLVDTNLVSNLYLLKYFLPTLQRSGNKDIVIIGSESSLEGARQGSVYCATKFAMRGLAQSLRADMAPSGGRVIMVNPGPTDTNFFDDLHFEPKPDDCHALEASSVALAIIGALSQPRNAVVEELNIQPLKRAFIKKPKT